MKVRICIPLVQLPAPTQFDIFLSSHTFAGGLSLRVSSAADILDDKGGERSAKSISPVRIQASHTHKCLHHPPHLCILLTVLCALCVCVRVCLGHRCKPKVRLIAPVLGHVLHTRAI
jgi:hypothetical protein